MLMIPLLSKELNLLGYSKLPYELCQSKTSKCQKLLTDAEFSDSDTDENSSNTQISFDTNVMIDSLVSVCLDLVKDIKISDGINNPHSDDYDRLKFECNSLRKNVDLQKIKLEKKTKIIEDEKEKCRQLRVKLEEMEKKLRQLERENLKIIKGKQLNEEIMKHKNQKIQKDLTEFHKILWKKYNVVEMDYMPQNFEIIDIKQPNFKNLWSDIKYSSKGNKEEAFKKVICVFQENNETLLRDNLALKTLLYITLEEINSFIEFIFEKMKLPLLKMNKKDFYTIFMKGKGIDVQKYKNFLKKQFNIFVNLLDCFVDCSFYVADSLFVCLSDVERKVKIFLTQ